MPKDHYIRIFLNGQPMDIESVEDLGMEISYHLEDADDFQSKKTSEAYELSLPATRNNDKIFNSFRNPNVQDMTPNQLHRNLMPCTIEAGIVLLSGYGQLKSANDDKGGSKYLLNCYGSNGDWSIPMKDLTLAECVNQTTHILDTPTIEASWMHDGTNENEDYVYAPVRYRRPFANNDSRLNVTDMRPAMFIYWILVRAFRTVGYEIVSEFMNLPYFRRQVMPWTWGDFLNLNSNASDELKFRATGDVVTALSGHQWIRQWTGFGSTIWGPNPITSWDIGYGGGLHIDNTSNPPGYDNGNNYTWDPVDYKMRFTYPVALGGLLGTITCHFTLRTVYRLDATYNGNVRLWARVFKNGVLIIDHLISYINAPMFGSTFDSSPPGDSHSWNFDVNGVNPGDFIDVQYYTRVYKGNLGHCKVMLRCAVPSTTTTTNNYTSLEMHGITIEPGGVVDIKKYEKLKSYKVLDLLRGVIDHHDLTLVTDSFTRKVYMEPINPYSVNQDLTTVTDGHFTAKHMNWNEKRDLQKPVSKPLFSDMEREFYMKHKADNNDGGQNKYRLKNGVEPGEVYYLFPRRFKSGKKELVNRFFGTSMHVFMKSMENISGVAPQLMAILPENIANTSKNESEMAFNPRIAYYKGLMNAADYGGWNWEGTDMTTLPFMFAVNYRFGGHKDPIFTYCNQRLETGGVPSLGIGLGHRFYMRRFIMFENGQQYIGYFYLDNNDIANWRHRERIIIDGAEYLVFSINDYMALKDESTQVMLWKVAAIARHYSPTGMPTTGFFPSDANVMTPGVPFPAPDIPYKELLLLYTDLTS